MPMMGAITRTTQEMAFAMESSVSPWNMEACAGVGHSSHVPGSMQAARIRRLPMARCIGVWVVDSGVIGSDDQLAGYASKQVDMSAVKKQFASSPQHPVRP